MTVHAEPPLPKMGTPSSARAGARKPPVGSVFLDVARAAEKAVAAIQ
jgi:hypothetical protein